MPSKLRYKNCNFELDQDIAHNFNDFFVNIGNSVENKIPTAKNNFSAYMKKRNVDSLFANPVDEDELMNMLGNLNTSKSCGPYSIPSNLLKQHAVLFLKPLLVLLNTSLEEGVFPDFLKLAEVCPIFKKNDKNKCENYRPISLLSNISKLYERMMHTRLYGFFEKFQLFYKHQFGFRKQHSTNHAILSIIEDIRNSLDKREFVCGVFIDLEKAFDTVNHKILLQKLEHYGVRGICNSWFNSYLSNRKQKVKFKDKCSEYLDITCGVPQGSILGPLLFLIYINDMNCAVTSSSVFHFADDTYLKYSSSSEKNIRKNMNKDLDDLFEWLCANRLSLNVSKTEFIIFKPPKKSLSGRITLALNGTTLFESKKIKYLGLIVDDRLSWKFHIHELSKKLSRIIGVLCKMRKIKCDENTLQSIYYALFQSQLMYGIMAWGTAGKFLLEKIRLIQKKAVRIISSAKYTAHTSEFFKKLNILKLDDLFKAQTASFMWDFDHGTLPEAFNSYFTKVSDVHQHNTRASVNMLSHTVSLTNGVTHSSRMVKSFGVTIFNEIAEKMFYKNCNMKATFRKKYKLFLIEQY